jgi:hypothetical protein
VTAGGIFASPPFTYKPEEATDGNASGGMALVGDTEHIVLLLVCGYYARHEGKLKFTHNSSSVGEIWEKECNKGSVEQVREMVASAVWTAKKGEGIEVIPSYSWLTHLSERISACAYYYVRALTWQKMGTIDFRRWDGWVAVGPKGQLLKNAELTDQNIAVKFTDRRHLD